MFTLLRNKARNCFVIGYSCLDALIIPLFYFYLLFFCNGYIPECVHKIALLVYCKPICQKDSFYVFWQLSRKNSSCDGIPRLENLD